MFIDKIISNEIQRLSTTKKTDMLSKQVRYLWLYILFENKLPKYGVHLINIIIKNLTTYFTFVIKGKTKLHIANLIIIPKRVISY